MFDIGFWELAVVGVVALLVIGPERLPAVARTIGLWVGKARRFVSSVQSDISREMNKSEQLARLLEEQSKLKEMHEIIEQTVDDSRKTVAVGNQQFQTPQHQSKPFHDDIDDEVSKTTHASTELNAQEKKAEAAKTKVAKMQVASQAEVGATDTDSRSPDTTADTVNEKNQ